MTNLMKSLLATVVLAVLASAGVWVLDAHRGIEFSCRDSFVYEGSNQPLRITGNIAFHFSPDLSGYASVSGGVDWQGNHYVLSRESRFRYTSVGKNTVQIHSVHFYADQRDNLPANFTPDKLMESLFFRPPPGRLVSIRRIANVWLIGNINSGVFACPD
ncbi:MAG: hypothetical protein ACRCWW_09315 [Scandinavium sp.]|uniref:hypothetical protein n=1 Tax=Scandinavium sp. TaxID=2830653 RepID=UPI003F41A215